MKTILIGFPDDFKGDFYHGTNPTNAIQAHQDGFVLITGTLATEKNNPVKVLQLKFSPNTLIEGDYGTGFGLAYFAGHEMMEILSMQNELEQVELATVKLIENAGIEGLVRVLIRPLIVNSIEKGKFLLKAEIQNLIGLI